ncbi:MAG: glycosyltransferase family 4 protein [Hyphomicrobiales bacterium]|nr:glycosyltransferase family 4 protein [Hyphomicrobiales bacterium]
MVSYAGSERVVEQMLACFPEADVFTAVDFVAEADRAFLKGKIPNVSFVQRLPLARKHYRNYLPLMALAVEQFDLSSYDLVLSSSHSVAKGVLTGPDQLHISYVHSPMRYAWDLQHQYLRESGLVKGPRSIAVRALLHWMRVWDARTAQGVDAFAANSSFVRRRIRKTYRREATVIHPPVDVSHFGLKETKEDFYLTVSRMVPYKKIPTIVEAFSQLPNRRLVVVGDGPDMRRAAAAAKPNVDFLGYQSTETVRDLMQRAKAFVFAAEEDFGIAPVEAQACGTPVIAYGKGGVLETICDGENGSPTGLFFAEQTPSAIADAVRRFELRAEDFAPANCRANALAFRPERFRAKLMEFVEISRRNWARDQAAGRIDAIAA